MASMTVECSAKVPGEQVFCGIHTAMSGSLYSEKKADDLSINSLHKEVLDGVSGSEERLFARLSDSFRIFAQQRIWSAQDAEDIVQDALATVVDKHKSIRFETSFSAWAYRILENKVLEYYRYKRTRESKFEQIARERSRAEQSDPDPTLQRRLLQCLRKIGAANPRYARVLNLQYQGYETQDICDKLGVTRNGLYILLSRARSMLKLCLQKGDIEQ